MSLATELQIDTDAFVEGRFDEDDNDQRSGSNSLALSWLVLAVPLAITLIGAWTYRWVQKRIINFRVIANLLAGHGPVFNVGERVEVYSDPLWVFLVAVTHEIVPFLSLEWLSVILGLVGTAAGVTLCGRGIQRLGSRKQDGVIVPVGLLIFSVVAGVWEFATSGLEMGMVFGWIGLSFWLLVRTEARRRSAVGCAFVMGLGPLIRPELVLMSVVFVAGLVASALLGGRALPGSGAGGSCRRSRLHGSCPRHTNCGEWPTSQCSSPTASWRSPVAAPTFLKASPTSGASSPPMRCGFRFSWSFR